MNELGKENHRGKRFALIVMGIYLLFLCWLILFKLADSVEKIPSMRAVNLIPFYYDQLAHSSFHLKEVLYNVLAFIPAGFFFTAFGKKKLVSGIAVCALLSLVFESLQWIFALGASDITDLITNTLGGALGAGTYFGLGKLSKGRQVRIVTVIGAVLETGFLVLFLVLMIANS